MSPVSPGTGLVMLQLKSIRLIVVQCPPNLFSTHGCPGVFTQRPKMVEVSLPQAQQVAYQRENEALPLQAHGLACSDSAMLRGGWVLRQLSLQGSPPCATLTHN